MTASAANVKSGQVLATTGAWAPVEGDYQRLVTLYAEDSALLVCSGHDTPVDGLAFKMPAKSALELNPIPVGQVFVKSVDAPQQVYLIGA